MHMIFLKIGSYHESFSCKNRHYYQISSTKLLCTNKYTFSLKASLSNIDNCTLIIYIWPVNVILLVLYSENSFQQWYRDCNCTIICSKIMENFIWKLSKIWWKYNGQMNVHCLLLVFLRTICPVPPFFNIIPFIFPTFCKSYELFYIWFNLIAVSSL